MTSDEQKAFDRELVTKHIRALMEHFDTVQIFVSRHMPAEEDGTITLADGGGHWLARRGQVRDWQLGCDEVVRERQRKHE